DGLEASGGFIPHGPHQGQVILIQSEDETQQVSLLDPAHPDRKQTINLPHRVYDAHPPHFDEQGGILLAGARGPGPGSDPLFVYIDSQRQVHEFYPATLSYLGAILITIRQGRAVYMD